MYSQATADRICQEIAEGKSLRRLCKEDGMPPLRTVFDWLEAHEEFRTKYTRARIIQAEGEVDEMRDIADDGSNDWMEVFDKNGEAVGWRTNGEAVQRSKIRLEQRRWYAEKLLPKKYGAKLEVSGDPERPLVSRIENIIVEPKK